MQVARMRMQDAVCGDVVNRVPDATEGWFQIGIIETLFDGKTQFSSADRRVTLSGHAHDICGVQVLKPVEMEMPIPPEVMSEEEAAAAAPPSGH
ncbi:MAG: hypothetical protein R2710_30780 [Acidimicrobiales bacterium]